MGWFARKFDKFQQLPRSLMIAHVTAKFTFGFWLGIKFLPRHPLRFTPNEPNKLH